MNMNFNVSETLLKGLETFLKKLMAFPVMLATFPGVLVTLPIISVTLLKGLATLPIAMATLLFILTTFPITLVTFLKRTAMKFSRRTVEIPPLTPHLPFAAGLNIKTMALTARFAGENVR